MVSVSLGTVFCQDLADARYVDVMWEVGDEKHVSRIDSTVTYANSEVLASVGARTDYKIKILGLKDSIYRVGFSQFTSVNNFEFSLDTIDFSKLESTMKNLIGNVESKLAGLEYVFLVDQYSGQAYEVENESELIETMQKSIDVSLDEFIEVLDSNLTINVRETISNESKKMLLQKIPAVLQTMINSFNYIFQGYSFAYIPNDTYQAQMETYDIDAVRHGDEENLVNFIINSNVKESILTMRFDYQYDQEDFYQRMVVANGRSNEISREEFDMKENATAIFDLDSSWIKSHISNVFVKMGMVNVNQFTRVIIE